VGLRKPKGSESWVESKEKKEKRNFDASLSILCPSLGHRSLPSFVDAGSRYIVEVAGKEVKYLGG